MGRNLKTIGKALLLLASLACAGYLFELLAVESALDQRWIDAAVRDHGASGVLLYLVMGALFTAVGLPRQVVAFLGGYAFGWWQGALLSTLAAGLGCVLAFYYARWLASGLIRRRYAAKVARFEQILALRPLQMALLLRLLPVGSNLLTNLAAGVCAVPLGGFLAGSMLGFMPQMLVFALTGNGITVGSHNQLILSAALLLLSLGLGLYLLRQIQRDRQLRALDEELQAAQAGEES